MLERIGDGCFFELAYLDPYPSRTDISIDESEESAASKRHARFVSCLSGDARAARSREFSLAELYRAEDVVWTPR